MDISTNMYKRCPTCRGLKTVNGLGGLVKDCLACDGSGKVLASVLVANPVASNTVAPAELVDHSEDARAKMDANPVVETVPFSQVLSEAGVPAGVIAEMAQAPVMTIPGQTMFPGYSDALMEAILAETGMAIPEWKNKFRGVSELFEIRNGQPVELIGVRERASIRELYGLSRPVAPRKVDVMASQDRVAAGDAEYQRQVKSEQKLNASGRKK